MISRSAIAALLLAVAASPALAEAYARPRSAPAKGTKDCIIGQMSLEHQAKYGKSASDLKFSVQKSGSVKASIAEDTYPGSTFYFMIAGKRYSGNAGYQLPLDGAALAALKAEKPINYTFTTWPYRKELSREDVYTAFTKAYDECRQLLAKPGF